MLLNKKIPPHYVTKFTIAVNEKKIKIKVNEKNTIPNPNTNPNPNLN